MSYMHPDAVEHHRKRWLRHDAHRFAKPGTPEAETGLMHPWAEVARREQAAADAKALAEAKARADQDALQREILDLRRDWAALKLEIAAKRAAERREVQELRRKSDLAYENLLRVFKRYAQQHKYSPDQPRVPAGNPDGGQWTDGGGSGTGRDTPSTDFSAQARRDNIQLAADNRRQNKMVRDVVVRLQLSKDQQQELHRDISGQGYTYLEILQRAKEMFGK